MKEQRACLASLSLACLTFVALFCYVSYPKSPTAIIAKNAPGLGFGCVLVQRYSGQQGAAVKALASLQRWIRDVHLPMVIVEPILYNSVMGVRKQGVRFSDMFDLDHFNAVSRSEGVPELIDWPTYLAKAPRTAVFIKMNSVSTKTIPDPQLKWNATNDRDCVTRNISGPDSTSISLCQVRTVTGYWKFVSVHTLSEGDVYGTVLGGLDPTNITLVFSLWRGPWEIPHSLSPTPRVSNNITESRDKNKFHDSLRLHLSSQLYQKKFLTEVGAPESRYVAVMIRAEHAVLEIQHSPRHPRLRLSGGIEKCMRQLQVETSEAMRRVGTTQLLVTSDVGRYGSGSWEQTIHSREEVADVQQTVMRGVERLYGGRWSFEQWEDSFLEAADSVQDRGYVAALQRVLATEADCFVLFGGGLFQELSLENYLHRTSNHTQSRCIRLVCVQSSYLKTFHSMMREAGESI